MGKDKTSINIDKCSLVRIESEALKLLKMEALIENLTQTELLSKIVKGYCSKSAAAMKAK